MVPVNATTYPAPSQPSVHAVADVLRGAHTAIRYRSWTQTEPAAGRGPVHALTAIGIGVAGWLYDPRTILSPGDERLYEAAITHLATHLGLDQPDDPDQFTAWHDAPGRTEADVLNALQATARVLEGYHPDRVFTPTARDVTSVHHGVALICYGEDASYLAIGHIPAALMVQASQACNLHLTGEPLADGTRTPAALEREVRHEWTVHWRDIRGGDWFDFDPGRRTPGAVPVTVLPGD
ncbi:hypothetical protein GCM10010390_65490 [Streptomyces mordarskii]|uniref:Uncharacterized protein n=1 Tax=Streptomyces mordarskii TaxID=1226758 RepID=A0ABN1DWS3_9ACTN